MSLQALIGDYQSFFSDLLRRSRATGIELEKQELTHLLYRTAELGEYEVLRDQLRDYCSEFVETQFNGRAVAIAKLKEPLLLEEGFTVSLIELPAPRSVHTYPSGLESIGIYLGDQLPSFIEQHNDCLNGIKDHGKACQPAFITFDNDKTVKFYDHTLIEIILLQGWLFENLQEAADSPFNRKVKAHNQKRTLSAHS